MGSCIFHSVSNGFFSETKVIKINLRVFHETFQQLKKKKLHADLSQLTVFMHVDGFGKKS